MYIARVRYKFIVYNLLYKLSACSYKYYLTVNRRAAIVVARYIKRIRDVTRDLRWRRRRRRTNDGRACPFYAGQPTQSNDRHTLVGTRVCPSRNRNRSSSPSPCTWVYNLIIIICAPLYCNSIPHIRVFISLMLL